MKQTLWTCIFFLLCVLANVSQAATVNQNEYRVGVILPLTGDNASLGIFVKNGLELALKQLPSGTPRLKLLYEDDQLQAARAVAAYRKLRSTDQIQAVIVLGSGDGNAVAPLAEAEQVLMISIGASDVHVVKERRFAFIHWIAPEREAEILSDEILQRGFKRIALVTTDQQGCIAMKDAIRDSYKKRGLEAQLVMDEIVAPGARDFKTIISKLKASEIDLVVASLFEGSLSSLAKQMKQQRVGADLSGAELFEDENEVKASEGTLLGKWYVNVDNPTDAFIAQYKAAYGSLPGWGAANAYDTLMLLSSGFGRYGRDTKAMADYMRTISSFSGAMGTYSASGDNRFNLPAAIKVVEKGGFRKLR